eukprot:gene13391-biopygen13381
MPGQLARPPPASNPLIRFGLTLDSFPVIQAGGVLSNCSTASAARHHPSTAAVTPANRDGQSTPAEDPASIVRMESSVRIWGLRVWRGHGDADARRHGEAAASGPYASLYMGTLRIARGHGGTRHHGCAICEHARCGTLLLIPLCRYADWSQSEDHNSARPDLNGVRPPTPQPHPQSLGNLCRPPDRATQTGARERRRSRRRWDSAHAHPVRARSIPQVHTQSAAGLHPVRTQSVDPLPGAAWRCGSVRVEDVVRMQREEDTPGIVADRARGLGQASLVRRAAWGGVRMKETNCPVRESQQGEDLVS